MKKRQFPALGLVTLVVIVGASARAADNELYDTPPPDDAAFIRWLEPGPNQAAFGVLPIQHNGHAYHPVSAAQTTGAISGQFYTSATDAHGAQVVIAEPERPDRSKVHLILLNLSASVVRLALADSDVEVISKTSANEASARAVNPVSATLNVEDGNGQILGVFDVNLRRGQNLTFVVRPEGAELLENHFGPNIGTE